jgi:hypothetical protein
MQPSASCAATISDDFGQSLRARESPDTVSRSREFQVHIHPVRLPLGRFRLLTSPSFIGSPPIPKTIGIVVVAAFAASAGKCADRNDRGHRAAH